LVVLCGHGRLRHQEEQLSAGEKSFRRGHFENGEKFAMSQRFTSQPPQIKSRLGAILRATSGNFLEQFDFFLFGFYASYIAKAFFPSENETAALLNTFGVFWLGALMRPVGAIVLGAYIDRIGRRKGLIVTLAIMAAGTVTIAVCPTYATIGVAAPAIVLIGRLLQGFSAGVELGGVSVYLSEIATPGNKGFYTSFQSASQQVAIFVAALIGYALNEAVSGDTVMGFISGGDGIAKWRIPFFIGCLIIPFIFFLRRTLEETPAFLAMKKHPSTSEVFSSAAVNWKIILLGMMLAAMTTVTFYFVTVYTPTFGKTVLKLSSQDALLVTLLVAVTNFIWNPVGGALSDRIGRKPVLLAIAGLSFVTAYPALLWLTAAPTFGKMLAVELMFSLYFGVYSGTMLGALVEIVPAHVRTTCFSLAFALAAALFGTFTPFAATTLIAMTGDKASPGFWLMCAAASGFIAAIVIYRSGAVEAREAAVALQT
jgi:MHS family citrate/tricarballylate:H+ symporter-like MFS transporter